ncbi:hypothetical protein L0938_07765 [Paracidovorax citrulli]
MKTHGIRLIAILLAATPAFAQSHSPITPVWKQGQDAPEPYTGKYCDYAAFAGLEFTFSDDAQFEKYGFQSFSLATNGIGSLPFAEYAGKKGKIGRPTERGTREVLIEDCTVAYLLKSGELQAEDAGVYGITFAKAPPTKWVSSQQVDRMTDARSCQVIPQGVDTPFPMFHYHSKEGFSAGVVGGDFPGRPATFRVDKIRAISEQEGLSGHNATTLVAQIRGGGKVLLVGSYEWPNDYEQVREFNLDGLVAALDQCKRSVAE